MPTLIYNYEAELYKTFDMSADSAGAPKYVNSVWDTQKAGSDKTHYWTTSPEPDVSGVSYDGPGSWGVHTSGFSTKRMATTVDVAEDTGAESNLWMPPETPHALDDEFDQSSIDSSWLVYNYSDTAVGSFGVDQVDVYDGSFTSGNVLRASLNSDYRRSWLLMQAPVSKVFLVHRLYTPPTNVLIVSRIRFNQYYSTHTANDRNVGFSLFGDSGGFPDVNNGVQIFINEADAGVVKASKRQTISGSETDITDTTNVSSQGQALEYVSIHKVGTTYHFWAGTASGNWIWMGSLVYSNPISHFAFTIYCNTSGNPGAGVVGIDFVRFYETDNFLL